MFVFGIYMSFTKMARIADLHRLSTALQVMQRTYALAYEFEISLKVA